MNKKEFTKKQLKKQLTTLTEEKSARSETALKKDLKNSFDALKKLDQVTTGQKIGDVTITKAMNKKIKNAKRYIEDLYDNITDGEIEEKEQNEENEVTERNEKSEGYGRMYNALKGVRESKVIKINEDTLKRIVERVINEQDWPDTSSKVSIKDQIKVMGQNMDRDIPIAYQNEVSLEDLTEEQLAELYSYIEWIKSVLEAKANQGNP
jgi:hypothetical protein